jgi:hypothetical protein
MSSFHTPFVSVEQLAARRDALEAQRQLRRQQEDAEFARAFEDELAKAAELERRLAEAKAKSEREAAAKEEASHKAIRVSKRKAVELAEVEEDDSDVEEVNPGGSSRPPVCSCSFFLFF